MQHGRQSGRRAEPGNGSEHGFVMIAVLFLVALILIGLAVAAPKIAKSIQRDKEQELIHRGDQYRRAIKLYYRKFGSYPSSIDQLINTNQVRFLRKRYKDPMSGKDDWKLIYFGQAKVQPLGLFGQPLGGSAGIAGAAGIASPIGTSPTGSGAPGSTTGSTDGSGSAFGGSSSGGSSFGGSSFGGSSFGGSSSGGSGFGGTSSSGSSFGSGFGSQSPSGGSGFGSSPGTTGNTDSGFGSTGTTGTGTPGAPSTGGAFGSSGSTGSTFGSGGPIVGVEIPDTRASMKEYKKQKHYNEWEFVYNPLEDQLQAAGALGGGQQNLNGATGTGSGTGFGSVTGGATLLNGGQSGGSFGSFGGGLNGGTQPGGSQNGNPPVPTPPPPPQQ